VIISDSNKFIFIHNPKCAGTTIRKSLNDFDTRGNYFWMHDEIHNLKVDKAHLTLPVLKAKHPNVISDMQDYFVFGLVRNPLERVVSAFNETHQQLLKDASENKSVIPKYSEILNNFCCSLTHHNTKGWSFRYRHCVQQKQMYFLGNKCMADLILKTEELTNDINKLNLLLPCISDASSTWNKKIRNKKVMTFKPIDLLTNKSISVIKKTYQEDFDIFGY